MSNANRRPRYHTEVLEEKKTAVVVYTKKTKLIELLVKLLAPVYHVYEVTYHESFKPPKTDIAVYVNITIKDKEILKRCALPIFFLFFNQEIFGSYQRWCKNNLLRYKLVHIGRTTQPPSELLSFILYKTPTPYVFDYAQAQDNFREPISSRVTTWFSRITLRKLFLWFVILVGALNILFYALFGYYVFALSQFAKKVGDPDIAIRKEVSYLEALTGVVTTLSIIPRNTLFWIPGQGYVLRIVDAGNTLTRLADDGLRFIDGYGSTLSLLAKKNKSPSEVSELKLRLKNTTQDTNQLLDSVDKAIAVVKRLDQKKLLTQLLTARDDITTLQSVQPHLGELLGESGLRRYVVLFMNNMELRPGGGFIGSIGILEFNTYTLASFKVYDVYSIDGQLKTHIDPPDPIRTYLNQPHWFLRDSNFSPDFSQDSDYALQFLKRSVNWEGFDGVIGVTFSGVQSFLDAFPELTLPDYNEVITSDNFFVKAQSYAEHDFFSGSHNKRDFLQAVVHALEVRIQEKDYDSMLLAKELKDSLDEKRIVLWFKNEAEQHMALENFWSGQLSPPSCTTVSTCISDYLLIVDANLGVNKANFFVQRGIQVTTAVENGKIVDTVSITYKNESPQGQFPGGDYHNYVQLYLPGEVEVSQVKLDNEDVSYSQQVDGGYRVVGVWFTVPAGQQRNVTLVYRFNRTLDESPTYQLIVQKQIGSINNDLVYEFIPSSGYVVSYTNFPNLVQDGRFVYNTFLEKDRLLLIRLQLNDHTQP